MRRAADTTVRAELSLDAVDRRIVKATEAGLPLCREPYREIAGRLGISSEEVMRRMCDMLAAGVIRRIAAVPNHFRLGFHANGMSVWDVSDTRVSELGARVGALGYVSHCYRRPRRLPAWPYNLFAMVHGRDRAEVLEKVARIADLLGGAKRGHEVLFSSRILKKTGMRLSREVTLGTRQPVLTVAGDR